MRIIRLLQNQSESLEEMRMNNQETNHCDTCLYDSDYTEYPCSSCRQKKGAPYWQSKENFIKDYGIEKKKPQEAKADVGKLDPTLVPTKIIWDIAVIRRYGVKKYKDPDNWKRVSAERYRSAAFRHFLAYLDDPKGVDDESGYPHLWHLATNIAFLCEMEE